MKKLTNEELQVELKRLNQMKFYENKYADYIIAGIDEAGRGPLFGPVVAGCVVLDMSNDILYVNDSKKISEKKREVLYDEILNKSFAYGIGIVDNKIIDEINILEATHLAMREAYNNCDEMLYKKFHKHISMLLVDALHIKNVDINQVGIIKGDELSVSIACASIIAKVYRDRMMLEYDKLYPSYGICKHKGYGTKQHIDSIKKYGITPLHRLSFLKNIKYE